MLTKEDIHFIIALIINVTIVALLIRFIQFGNDKDVVFPILAYPVQITLNGIIWLMMRMDRDPRYRIYRWMTLALIIAFIPVTIISTMY